VLYPGVITSVLPEAGTDSLYTKVKSSPSPALLCSTEKKEKSKKKNGYGSRDFYIQRLPYQIFNKTRVVFIADLWEKVKMKGQQRTIHTLHQQRATFYMLNYHPAKIK